MHILIILKIISFLFEYEKKNFADIGYPVTTSSFIVARIKYLEFGQVFYNLTISWAGRGNWGNRAVMGLGYYRYILHRY